VILHISLENLVIMVHVDLADVACKLWCRGVSPYASGITML
jgi:hypothetical protein